MNHRIATQSPSERLDIGLSQYVASFVDHLTAQNYASGTIQGYRVLIRRLALRMESRGIRPEQLTVEIAAELVQGETQDRRRPRKWVNMARRFLAYLIDIDVAAAPPATPKQLARATLRRDYEDYLRRQRGLSDRSIYHCWRIADRFLDHRFGDQDYDLRQIMPNDIVAFLRQLTTRQPPFRDKTPPTHLRNFLGFLFQRGVTSTNLALCVPSVAQRYDARLPRHFTPVQVETVLAALRDNPKHGRRDYAMVLLMARLGLRAPEVVAIQLEDIDWRTGELLVRSKGQWHDRVPIPPDVGEALVDYLRNDRIAVSRTLFVKRRAPHAPFKGGQILNLILRDALAKTGLKPPCPYVGSHLLRHSLATNMVRNGASLAEVGDMLRHRSRTSTLIYAKVDIDGLRAVAQAWPTTGGAP